MSERYFMERGDVLMSVHLVLAAEWEQKPLPAPVAPRPAGSPVDPGPRPVAQQSPLRRRPAPVRLIDPATGAPDLDALRRDVHLAGGSAGLVGDRSVLAALRVAGLTEIRAAQGADAATAVLSALVELVPFSLRGRDRVYRVGFDELVFLMTNTFDEGAEAALERFAEESERMLSARALPTVQLLLHILDPGLLAQAV